MSSLRAGLALLGISVVLSSCGLGSEEPGPPERLIHKDELRRHGLIPIPPGPLQAGSTDRDLKQLGRLFTVCPPRGTYDPECYDEGWWELEQPIHEVGIRAFAIAPYEVTVREWEEFADATGHESAAERCDPCGQWYDSLGWHESEDLSWRQPAPEWTAAPDEPVVQVSAGDAEAYIDWISERDGISYRLPTQEEHEWAAWGDPELGAAKRRPLFPFPADRLSEQANYADRKSGLPWKFGGRDGYRYAAPVGSFPANDYGIFDLIGNVREWTNSRHASYRSGKPRPGTREVRGGSFIARAGWSRPQSRMFLGFGTPTFDTGFRLAADYARKDRRPKAGDAKAAP